MMYFFHNTLKQDGCTLNSINNCSYYTIMLCSTTIISLLKNVQNNCLLKWPRNEPGFPLLECSTIGLSPLCLFGIHRTSPGIESQGVSLCVVEIVASSETAKNGHTVFLMAVMRTKLLSFSVTVLILLNMVQNGNYLQYASDSYDRII